MAAEQYKKRGDYVHREPKQGTNASSKRIAAAVDNEDWQRFRDSLKGLKTAEKLRQLQNYYNKHSPLSEDDEIRLDNYIKALARGGQLFEGASLSEAKERGGITRLPIKRN